MSTFDQLVNQVTRIRREREKPSTISTTDEPMSAICLRIPKSLHDTLRLVCVIQHVSMTEVLRRAAIQFCESVEIPKYDDV